ncbi:caspase-1-like [Elgaria multicarinata webbii]|uniref:caspase-1-like n=1 Tax=Elgaria multicarinata webbii TaxID=159646 RepID=UPI002FCD625F
MADKKLGQVRTLFVNGVNKAIINQLVDELLCKGVLNEEEGDEVKENPKKQDQARTLIDHVKRKGPKASLLFIELLQCQDSCLAEMMDLATFRSAPGGPVCQQVRDPCRSAQPPESKNGITLCPPDLFQKIQAEEASEIYRIEDPQTRTRLALIICNIAFEHCPRRNGAQVDLAQMTLLLEGLGYKVEVETNLCSQGMTDRLKCFAAREEHKTSDGTFLVLMSHGLRDGLCGVKSQGQHSDILSIDTIVSTFNNKNCQALMGKPKVIVIQACRGGNDGFTYVSDSTTPTALSPNTEVWSPEGYEKDAIQKVHVESDFICLYSTTPDHVSWRSPQTGSIFIVQLIEHIKKHAWNCNLEEIFRKVMYSFENNPRQMPTKDRTTLSRKFYLFPGH